MPGAAGPWVPHPLMLLGSDQLRFCGDFTPGIGAGTQPTQAEGSGWDLGAPSRGPSLPSSEAFPVNSMQRSQDAGRSQSLVERGGSRGGGTPPGPPTTCTQGSRAASNGKPSSPPQPVTDTWRLCEGSLHGKPALPCSSRWLSQTCFLFLEVLHKWQHSASPVAEAGTTLVTVLGPTSVEG